MMDGKEMEALRKARGLSRADMAKAVNGTQGGVWSLENGRTCRDAGLEARIEAFLGAAVVVGREDLPVPVLPCREDWTATAPWGGIKPGDWINVIGVEGEYRFIRHIRTSRGATWVDVIGGTRQHTRFRSFDPDLVIGADVTEEDVEANWLEVLK
jgi:transcriptional regulator with XRE-family HTH domain